MIVTDFGDHLEVDVKAHQHEETHANKAIKNSIHVWLRSWWLNHLLKNVEHEAAVDESCAELVSIAVHEREDLSFALFGVRNFVIQPALPPLDVPGFFTLWRVLFRINREI